MAQLALSIGGAIAGSYFGPIGSMVGSAIGSAVGSMIDSLWMGGSPTAAAPTLHDGKFQANSYGQPIVVGYGTFPAKGTLIAKSKLLATKVDGTQVGGGLGLGGGPTAPAMFTYSASFAVLICEGPIGGVLRIWADETKKIYDVRPQGKKANHRGASIRIYKGTSDQMPDPWIQAHFGADITPAYRFRAYVVFEHMQLADFGNRVPDFKFECISVATPAYPYESADPGGGTDFDQDTAISDDGTRVIKYGFGGDLSVIDGKTVSVLLGPLNVLAVNTGGCVFGADGFLYAANGPVGNGGISNYVPWTRIDPASLQVLDTVGFHSTGFDSSNHDGLGLAGRIKNGRGIPYLLGVDNAGFFAGWEIQIVSIGQIEALLTPGTPAANKMRFVGKTEASGGPDLQIQDAEIDPESLVVGVGANGQQVVTFDFWGVIADSSTSDCHLYRYTVTDNLLLGGGTSAGGAFGANPINLIDTIDISSAWSGTGAPRLTYFADEHALIVIRGTKAIKYNLDSRTVTGSEVTYGTSITGSEMVQGPINGILTVHDGLAGAGVGIFDCSAWALIDQVNLGSYSGGFTLSSQKLDPTDSDVLWVREGTALVKILLHRQTGSDAILGDIVSDLCQRGGLSSGDLDVTALTDVVHGYVIPRQMSIRAALAPLMTAFFFVGLESDFKLKFVKLGGSSVKTLALDDIGAYPSQSQRPTPIAITDANERQLPRNVNVKYINAGANYNDGTQSSPRRRDIVDSVGEITLDVPIVLTDSEAKDIATRTLLKIWTNARKYDFPTSWKFQRLDPGDVITIPKGAETDTIAIDQIDAGADGVIKISGSAEDAEIYGFTSVGGGGGSGGISPSPNLVIGHTDLELMDIVLIRDIDDSKGYYAAAAPDTGDLDAWIGALELKSVDNGDSYQVAQTFTTAATIARATTVLAAPRAWTTWDRVNSVTVRPLLGAPMPSSISELSVLNGGNLALLGNELIQFADVTDNGDGTFTLSTLLRGLRGSDPYIGTHALGDHFVLIAFPAVKVISDPDLSLPRYYKVQSIGDSTIPATQQVFTDTGNRLRPLTGQGATLSIGGGSDLIIAWNRRTRIGGENDFADGVGTVPLGEAIESYEVDIYKAGVVVRTLTSTTPSVTYAAADQTTDFGSTQTALTLAIFQMSATVGRGFEYDVDLAA